MKNSGFTLVELSIVLVIIGLIIGGVLVGRDLITAATIRSQVSQFEQISAAVFTFKTKTNQLPGDISATEAAAFGLESRNGAQGNGDGNGLVEQIADDKGSCGEPTLFWDDLAKFNLIGFPPRFRGDYPNDCVLATTYADASRQYPPGKMRRNEFLGVIDIGTGGHFFAVIAFNSDFVTADGLTGGRAAATPLEAYNIDAKMDDGMPMTGRVWGGSEYDAGGGVIFTVPDTILTAASDTCTKDLGGDYKLSPYYTSDDDKADAISCTIWYAAGF